MDEEWTRLRVKGGARYMKAIVSGGQNGRYLRRQYRLGSKEKSLEKSSKYLLTVLACLRFKCCKRSMIVDALLPALPRLNILMCGFNILKENFHYYWLGCLMCENTGLSNPNKCEACL